MKPKHKKLRQAQVLTVAIVEDDDRIRSTLVKLINQTDGLRCKGSYPSSEAAIPALEAMPPDVILMDIGLPGLSGIECTRRIKERHPSTEILILTVYDDDEKIFQSIRAGATGYILKNADPVELIRAIHDIKTGAPMSATIARRVLGMLGERKAIGSQTIVSAGSLGSAIHRHRLESGSIDLTVREIEILDLLVDGLSYKRIAEKLFISPLTVHSHIKHIYEKLHVHSMSAAVSKALKHKLSR